MKRTRIGNSLSSLLANNDASIEQLGTNTDSRIAAARLLLTNVTVSSTDAICPIRKNSHGNSYQLKSRFSHDPLPFCNFVFVSAYEIGAR